MRCSCIPQWARCRVRFYNVRAGTHTRTLFTLAMTTAVVEICLASKASFYHFMLKNQHFSLFPSEHSCIFLPQTILEQSHGIHARGILRWPGPSNFQPKQKCERPICVFWSMDTMEGWRRPDAGWLGGPSSRGDAHCPQLRPNVGPGCLPGFWELMVGSDTPCSGSSNLTGKF